MTSRPRTEISEDELHAFLDGRLQGERRDAVASYLATHPQSGREVEAWRVNEEALSELLAGYAHGDESDIERIQNGTNRQGRGWAATAAAVVIALGLGGGAGYLAHDALAARDIAGSDWLEVAARDVFLTYVREVRHAVEVGANEREHLVSWLGNRIEVPFTAPSLADLGFELVGGRLLPIGGRPGAMLMYENPQGDRATVLLARHGGSRDTALRFSAEAGVNTFRWVDGPLAYAISGFLDRSALEDISRAVYAHFQTI